MASDGDLWLRAVTRGLDRTRGGLVILRPAGVSIVVAGRRVHVGPARTQLGFPRSGLYRAEPAPGGFRLRGIDRPDDEGFVGPPDAGPTWPPFDASEVLAIVEERDPASHAES